MSYLIPRSRRLIWFCSVFLIASIEFSLLVSNMRSISADISNNSTGVITNLAKNNTTYKLTYGQSSDAELLQLPYTSRYVSMWLKQESVVSKGMIILKNDSNKNLKFSAWGDASNHLHMSNYSLANNIIFNHVNGSTRSSPAGFTSQNLKYNGRFVSLITGDIVKLSRDFQISFVLDVIGDNNARYFLRFVNGPLFSSGWNGNDYYEEIDPDSSRLIDLRSIISSRGDEYVSLNSVNIVIEKQSDLQLLGFKIDLQRTTENPPILLSGGNSYYVQGYISQIPDRVIYPGYIFHNLGFEQLIDLNFHSVPSNSNIVYNGWNIIKIQNHTSTARSYDLSVTASKHDDTYDILDVIPRLDLFSSILNLSPKDILFLFVITTLTLILIVWRKFT